MSAPQIENQIIIGRWWSGVIASLLIIAACSFGAWAVTLGLMTAEVKQSISALTGMVAEHRLLGWHSAAGIEIARAQAERESLRRRLKAMEARLDDPR